jgi:hypothetical protein
VTSVVVGSTTAVDAATLGVDVAEPSRLVCAVLPLDPFFGFKRLKI